ncbi:putative HNH homing endonuclease [Ralstonia phage RsoP1IDN]|uniref:Putative HNH homing endonuclease n=1 Tax=Ralstonia phage RsoP1IDN TaxID=2060091 RepID=A0A2P0VPI4_9CAUD|nr:endonuclease [Ralstonia phage RsoP1IDN]AUG85445.1 putative HNH homing endonuclease [Ralstonia phage RsoP1IDN]
MNDRKRHDAVYWKLRQSDVEAVKARLADGFTQSAIAREFGITQQMVSMIKTGRHWA